MLAIGTVSAYIGAMFFQRGNSIWRDASPTGAIKDFAQVWKGNPYRWRTLAVAIAMTTGLMIFAIPKSERIPPRAPKVTYISTYEPGRTRKEIMASNIAHQKVEDKLEAIEKEREDYRKHLYEELGRATFVDVDAMKKQIAEEEAAQKKADEARAKQNMARIAEQQDPAGK